MFRSSENKRDFSYEVFLMDRRVILSKKRLKELFSEINTFKPDSSRSKSNEVFFICIGFKD